MSALAGILFDTESAVPTQVIDRLALANSRRGPDRQSAFVDHGVALTQYAVHFDALASRERQPLQLADDAVLTWDGRLDNRADLSLQLSELTDRPATDAAIVGAAWLAWGRGAFARLVGDWSLALWLPRERSVILARDYMGNRPLYFYHGAHEFAWSTCVETLVDFFDLYEQVDDDFVRGALAFGAPPGATPFARVRVVSAGHTFSFNWSGGLNASRFWDLPQHVIRYRTDDSYAERLRELFIEAVRVRLRASGPVWAHVSGGYDSSSIACAATHLVKAGQVTAPHVRFISRTFRSAPESDESGFIRAVEDWCGQSTLRIDDDRDYTLDEVEQPFVPFAGERADAPDIVAVSSSGGHTVLSGEIGDIVMAKSTPHSTGLVELLHGLELRRFVREVATWSRRRRAPWLQTLGQVLTAYAPGGLADSIDYRHRLEIVAGRLGTLAASTEEAFGLQTVAPSHRPPTPLALGALVSRFPASKRFLARMLYRCMLTGVGQTPLTPTPVSVTYPFSHRPLVEFVLAIPHTKLWEAAQTRALMRRAFAGFMPRAVLTRAGKGDPAAAITRLYRPIVAQLLDERCSWRLVERDYMKHEVLKRQYEAIINGSLRDPSHVPQLVSLEGWLRGIPHRRQRLHDIYASEPNGAHVGAMSRALSM